MLVPATLAANFVTSNDLVNVGWTLVAQIIAFLILLYILSRILYAPLTNAMNARAERIRQGLAQSEDAAKAAQEAQARTQAQLEEARLQAQEILRQASLSAEALRTQLVDEARREAQKVIERGVAEIARERQAAVDDLRRIVGDVAIQAATRVVEKSLDSAENRRLIDEAIRQSGALASTGLS